MSESSICRSEVWGGSEAGDGSGAVDVGDNASVSGAN